MAKDIEFNLSECTCLRSNEEYNFSIYLYQSDSFSPSILFTKGLSERNQLELAEVAENVYPFIELYFYLPTYWNLDSFEQSWPLDILEKIAKVPQKNNTWFGPGDTLPANKEQPPARIDAHFEQNYFILSQPLTKKAIGELEGISWDVDFLAVIPIFNQEFEFKRSRSSYEFFDKFVSKNNSELLDQYREPVAKKRFFGLF